MAFYQIIGHMRAGGHGDLGSWFHKLEWLIRLAALVIVPFKRKSTAAAWLLFFFLLPLIGLLLFLAIGEPRFPRWRTKRLKELLPFFDSVSARLPIVAAEELADLSPAAKLAHTLGHFPALKGNSIELIDDYDCVVSRLIGDIDAARSHVRLLIYIFADDEVGQSIINALGRAVSRGVRCHVLVDPVGSRQWIKSTVRSLKDAGVSTREALPFHWLRGRTRRDMRNHRKLFIIDGVIGYAGSQNIVAKDFRPAVVNRELVARCTGPIVSAMEAVTLVDWALETKDRPPETLPVPQNTGSAILQLLPSGADFPLEGFQTLLVWQLHQARDSAVIVTPYFIPDEDVIGALRTAVARGVRVDIIVSAVVDQRLVT